MVYGPALAWIEMYPSEEVVVVIVELDDAREFVDLVDDDVVVLV